MYIVSTPSLHPNITADWGEVLRLYKLYPNCKFAKLENREKLNFDPYCNQLDRTKLYRIGQKISNKYIQVSAAFQDNVCYVNYNTFGIDTQIIPNREGVQVMRKGSLTCMIYRGLIAENGLIGFARAIDFALSNIGDFIDVEIILDTMSELYIFGYSGDKVRAYMRLTDFIKNRIGRTCFTVRLPQFCGGGEQWE